MTDSIDVRIAGGDDAIITGDDIDIIADKTFVFSIEGVFLLM